MPGKRNSVKPGKLKRVDAIAERIAQATKFNIGEARCLILIHHKMESIGPLDVRRFREFIQIIFDITDEIMLDFLFHHFDADHSGHVDEFEFCEGLSTMTRGNIDQLADFSYSIYDINGDGSLAREEVYHCIKNCIYPGFGVEEDEVEECEREITDIVMRKLDMDKDGLITKEDFRAAARKNPLLLNGLGQCLPSGQCKGAFLGTFSEKHRQYSPDYPNVLEAIQRMDHRYNHEKRHGKNTGSAMRLSRSQSVMSVDSFVGNTGGMLLKGGDKGKRLSKSDRSGVSTNSNSSKSSSAPPASPAPSPSVGHNPVRESVAA